MGFISTANERRPQDFESLAGQNFIVTTIKNAIEKNHFAHAYLFAGPRGVGKTTSARLLAKALNCQEGPTVHPCGKCDSCRGIAASNSVDCIEIDGASNTSVDDIRKIKNDIMYPPASRFKIYIIDEVHMLSVSAFNALLKTIEEPPDYVIFIFATTELQKVPQTIKSRCQFFKFRAITSDTVMQLIKQTCKDNKVKIDRESLLWIGKQSGGSMRDAYTLYDQLVSFCGNDISFPKIQKELLLTSQETIHGIFMSALEGDVSACMNEWMSLCESGVTPEQFIEDFTAFVRAVLLYKSSVTSESVLFYPIEVLEDERIKTLGMDKVEMILADLLKLYRDIRYSVNPRFETELFLARLCDIKNRATDIAVSKRLKELHDEILSKVPAGAVYNASVPMPEFENKNVRTETETVANTSAGTEIKSEKRSSDKDIIDAFEATAEQYESFDEEKKTEKRKVSASAAKKTANDMFDIFKEDLT